jgi:hypothetical protein
MKRTRFNDDNPEGFEVYAELVGKVGGKTYRHPFPIKVNSLNPMDIQGVIDYWRDHLKQQQDIRKIVVKSIYRVEKVKMFVDTLKKTR